MTCLSLTNWISFYTVKNSDYKLKLRNLDIKMADLRLSKEGLNTGVDIRARSSCRAWYVHYDVLIE